jgi:putative lipoprotein
VRPVLAAPLFASLLLASPSISADEWFGRDKALHFGVSAAIASGGYGGARLASAGRATSFVIGGSIAAAAGLAKEGWDLAGHGDPSWKDLAWDAVGIAVGLALAYAIDRLVDREPQAMSSAQPSLVRF